MPLHMAKNSMRRDFKPLMNGCWRNERKGKHKMCFEHGLSGSKLQS